MNKPFAVVVATIALTVGLSAADSWRAPSNAQIDSVFPQAESLYKDIHENPELSYHEVRTAAKLTEELKRLGYDVTTNVGGTGIVGLLRNGNGPTVMIRAELDALPVPEKTGLAYASHVTTKNDQGDTVPVMHACGHDLHMAIGIATAALLAQNKNAWHGTFMFVGQPAEERIGGASKMLKDGLFTRIARPDYVIALHDTEDLPAGEVGFTPGYAAANSDSVDVTIYGKGAHGSAPQNGVDPIVIAARTILGWQTIISRENSPFDPGVITVGSIHGGTKHNIIPEEVHMQLTVRSYKDDVRKHLLDGIARIARAEAESAGAPKPPVVDVNEGTPAVYNDPALTKRVEAALKKVLGEKNVVDAPPVMASDDFAEYGRAGVPAMMFSLGAVDPEKFAAAKKANEVLPGPHSPFFAPDLKPSLRTGIEAETSAVLELLGKS